MNEKILIIDDSEELSKIEAEAFQKEGFEVETIQNSLKGIEKVKTGDYDLVILDLVMPNRTGFEVLNELKESKVVTPIIVYSSMWENMSREEVLKLGAKDFLEKGSVPLDILVEKIKRILSKI